MRSLSPSAPGCLCELIPPTTCETWNVSPPGSAAPEEDEIPEQTRAAFVPRHSRETCVERFLIQRRGRVREPNPGTRNGFFFRGWCGKTEIPKQMWDILSLSAGRQPTAVNCWRGMFPSPSSNSKTISTTQLCRRQNFSPSLSLSRPRRVAFFCLYICLCLCQTISYLPPFPIYRT